MTRFVNMLKVAALTLSSMYLLQIASCAPFKPFQLRPGGYSLLPNYTGTFSLNPLNWISTLTQGLGT